MSGIIDQIGQILGYGQDAQKTASVLINGALITGWTDVTVRCGVDLMPWVADLGMTSYQPDVGTDMTINEGDAVQLWIGTDQLITGYVVTVVEAVSDGRHALRLQIASKSMDLVDCSAEFSTYQMNSTNAVALAKRVAQFADINVSQINGAGNVDLQLFSVILTETAYEIIERVARLAGVLFYDLPDGNVAFAAVGSQRMASGLIYGENVEQMTSVRSTAGRFSSITAVLMTTALLFNKPGDADYVGQMDAVTSGAVAEDPGIVRTRPLLIPAELGDQDYAVTTKRVQWEVARRYGRANTVTVTCDSWRDTSGNLWAVNHMAPVRLKSGRELDLVIAEVVFRQGEDGTRADLVMVPPEGLMPEPLLLPALSNEGIQAINS
ncbi:phage baseplate assembly protein [Gluconobacter kondonii]|uniref:phage baseplate assembly protein n=1 Tax=Gluconobacter kondonii TaxID=941463 RepID=UPI00197E8AAC|nr:phage tail protein [Gluconobacter kondonii]MBN3866457.1 phage tail protein [Gluconobacter kondonii]